MKRILVLGSMSAGLMSEIEQLSNATCEIVPLQEEVKEPQLKTINEIMEEDRKQYLTITEIPRYHDEVKYFEGRGVKPPTFGKKKFKKY